MDCLYKRFDTVKKQEYACGYCRNCLINKREEWSVRLTHEWKYWHKSMFITLTYRDKDLPDNCSLRKQDLQNFWHYVRNDERMKEREIKYFSCGEYGDEGGQVLEGRYAGLFIHRPHYHAIVFGLDPFDDDDRKIISDNWTLCEPYIFYKKLGLHGEWLDKQAIDYVTPDNINYVCGYVEKKLIGDLKDEKYTSKGLVPPFSLSSQGIGKRYCLEHRKQILDLCYVQRKGHILPIPRQYKKWLGVDNIATLSPFINARDERHAGEKERVKKEIYNFDKIYEKAQKEVEKQFPDIQKRLLDSRYYREANHMFHRIVSREVERQAEMAYRELK